MKEVVDEINHLRNSKNAVILAHYYQDKAIQNIADFVGDSLALSQHAATTKADIIVFAGVHFMAETAKILNPEKKVLLPDLNAGCSLAESCPPTSFKDFVHQHKNHVVVTYINCSAEIKALSDIVCTSSNAEKVIASIPKDRNIIFAPDKNLGAYLIKKTGRKMVLWDGVCTVHDAFSIDKLLALFKKHPDAEIIAHPESPEYILSTASFIGSTAQMINHVKNSKNQKFIIGTEVGILHKMQEATPEKILLPVPINQDNTCACSECAYMKVNTLEKLRDCLKYEQPEINIEQNLQKRALKPIEKMLELS